MLLFKYSETCFVIADGRYGGRNSDRDWARDGRDRYRESEDRYRDDRGRHHGDDRYRDNTERYRDTGDRSRDAGEQLDDNADRSRIGSDRDRDHDRSDDGRPQRQYSDNRSRGLLSVRDSLTNVCAVVMLSFVFIARTSVCLSVCR